MTDRAINHAAAKGFERGAADYEQARPSYPADAVALIQRESGLGPGRQVLDLAAGTGKLTRLFVPSGADIVAVEPVAAMRATLQEVCPTVTALDGTAEAIPLDDDSVHAITVAQAFHWFDAQGSLREMHRVLKRDGTLFLVWNVRDETVDWVHEFTELIVERSGGRPYTPYHSIHETSGQAMQADHVGEVARSGLFEPVQQAKFDNPQAATPDAVVARAGSTSFVSALPEDKRSTLLAEVRALIATHPQTAGLDEFVFPHQTWVSWCAVK